MPLLPFLIIITSLLFILIAYDLYKRQKFTIIHFLVFLGGGGALILFAFDHQILESFAGFFGVARGADLIVYGCLIFLFFLFFSLLNSITRTHIRNTRLTRQLAINDATGHLGNKKTTAFVIPAYNESDNTLTIIQKVLDYNKHFAVIYVDDGSANDLHIKVCKQFAKSVIAIKHPINMGQGAALQTGMTYITQHLPQITHIVHFDADGQHRIQDIDSFLQAFDHNPDLDIVMGSRFLGVQAQGMSRLKHFQKKLQLLFTRCVVGLRLTDTHNGYRMLARRALPPLTITINGMAHASEIEHRIKTHNLTYQEVPIKVLYTEYSIAKGQKFSNAFKVAKDLIYRLLFFR